MIPFLAAVVIVAIAGTLLALNFLGMLGGREPNTITQLVTVQVVITATPDPNVTPNLIIITATPDRTQVAVPPEIVAAAATSSGAIATRPTLDVSGAQALNPSVAETATALPANCLLHTIQSGDTPFGIAVQYDANPFLLLEANGLTEETATGLQIGDTLIVPLEGCPVEQLASFIGSADPAVATPTPAEATDEATAEAGVTPTITPTPTLTLAPTAVNAQIQITRIEKIGDVTAEGIEIRNTGNTVNVTGWTLSDADNNVYTFGEQLLFSNSTVIIYTRPGQNTPLVLFWGLDKPVWSVGDVVTLRDNEGDVQATQRIDEGGLPR
jgi:hypothetical protein